jgi:DNA invertase Pin-like site-specific DNA recombinase
MRAAIYARVSRERCTGCGHVFDEHKGGTGRCGHAGCKCALYAGQHPENQLLELRRYATAQSWEVVEYIDRATGKNSDRDAFKELFVDASRRKFDVVIVWALDRMSREGIGSTFEHLKRLKGYGVAFESYTEPQFRTTGPGGEMFAELMIAIVAWMAKQERLQISERTKAGLERARRAGRIGGRRPKVFDRERAEKLRATGMSWRAMAREMGIAHSTIRDALEKRCAEKRQKGRTANVSKKRVVKSANKAVVGTKRRIK